MVVTVDILGQPGLLAVLLSVVVLLTPLEQAVLADVVVLPDLRRIVTGTGCLLRITSLPSLVRGFGSLIELSVAGVVLVPGAFFGHRSLSLVRPSSKATDMPVSLVFRHVWRTNIDLNIFPPCALLSTSSAWCCC